MKIKTPKFWNDRNIISDLLLPLSYLYSIIIYLRRIIYNSFYKQYRSNSKIICVGNLTCGGAGKTPVSIAIAELINDKKLCFVSKGYGRVSEGDMKITSNNHDPNITGDEPLLLANIATVYITKNRVNAVKHAEDDNFEIIITDDGLQDYSIYKDIKIIVIDGGFGFGNNRLIPSGPLRSDLIELQNADLIILIGEDKYDLINKYNNLKIIRAIYEPVIDHIDKNKKYIAFSGIARNKKFFDTVRSIGLDLVEEYSFPDHHYYNEKEIKDLISIAKENNAYLITTQKDFVKINANYKNDIFILPIKIRFIDKLNIINLLS